MNNSPIVKAICPLYNFEISEVIFGDYTREEGLARLKALGKRLELGFEILKDVRIRRIKKEDIERVKVLRFYDQHIGILHKTTSRTYVIEVLQKQQDVYQAQLKINNMLLAMRLYQASDIFCKVIWWEMESDVKTITILDSRLPELMGHPYFIEIDKVEEIRKMAKRIDKIDFGKRVSFRIACERFSRYYEEHREDEKIIDCMIAFEALFLKGKTATANTGQFIGLGCSMLLGRSDEEREEINKFLVEAYKIRNRIVHGSEFVTPIKLNNKTYEIYEFVFQLQKYLRESIEKLI